MLQLRKVNPEPGHETFEKTNVQEVLAQTLQKYELPKNPFESATDMLRRREVIDDFLKEYLRMNPQTAGKKHAIVCHAMVISTLTSEGEDPSDWTGLKNYTWAENCQLIPYMNI